MFELELGEFLYGGEGRTNRLVEMMHSGSPASIEDHIIDQFGDNTKYLRLVIATTAYGMGINCKGVTTFGPANPIESYMQESGRCGRNGDTFIYFNILCMDFTCKGWTLLVPV